MSQFTVQMKRFVNVQNILKIKIRSLSAKRVRLQSFIKIMLTGFLFCQKLASLHCCKRQTEICELRYSLSTYWLFRSEFCGKVMT